MPYQPGVRRFFAARKAAPAWTNPYITDGLIAMWDGEWNAGGGVHNASGGLVEIISGTPTYLRQGSYTVENDCIRVTGGVIASQSIQSIVDLAGGELTIEGCCLNDTSVYTTGHVMQLVGGRPFNGNMFASNGSYYMVHNSCTDSTFSTTWSTGWKTNRQQRAITVSQDTVQYYINGVANNSAAKTKQVETTTNPFSLFGWDWDFVFPASGDFCNLRIYNRVLTADEIAANYAVDKRRFNLP